MLPKTNKSIQQKIKDFSDVRILGLVVFGVIVLLVSWSGLKVLQTNYELEKEIAHLEQRNEVQNLENQNLALKNQYYETDDYLELAARRHFNKAQPGEKLYLVPESVALSNTADPKEGGQAADDTQKDKPTYQQNLEAWFEFLFGIKS